MAALYEWNYPRQMLHARLSESDGSSLEEREAQIFSEPFLLRRPLLEAISQDRSPVLLIDEVDRADEAFEAFLLEMLAEWQVTIPELGTIRARHKPHVILTSNRTRELSDALRRRCLFLWLPYPSLDQEIDILVEDTIFGRFSDNEDEILTKNPAFDCVADIRGVLPAPSEPEVNENAEFLSRDFRGSRSIC